MLTYGVMKFLCGRFDVAKELGKEPGEAYPSGARHPSGAYRAYQRGPPGQSQAAGIIIAVLLRTN